MEFLTAALLTVIAAISISLLLIGSRNARNKKEGQQLPPGPPAIWVVGNALWLRRSFRDLEHILRELRHRYGPVITLRFGSRPVVFVLDRRIAHELLVERGASFSGRLKPIVRFLSGDELNISGATYGPLWRLLRRNLTSEILHPHRVKLYAPGRDWVLGVLDADLRRRSAAAGGAVPVVESFQFAMFCLLALMCFGEKMEEEAIKDIEVAQRELLLYFSSKLNVMAILPRLGKLLFPGRLKTLAEMQRRQKELYQPLIAARREHKKKLDDSWYVYSYLDSLLDMELPEEGSGGGRRLTDDEIVVLCSEFLNAGTDTTSTALQWIMANLVKHPDVQAKLAEEIERETSGGDGVNVKEEELQRMKYLKAVVMEGLRRHPPGHFVLPHAVSISSSSSTEEKDEGVGVEVEGRRYVIPRDVSINFSVADINWDSGSWTAPMEFRPERFMEGGEGEGVDLTGSREVRMMPFGAGRRICPGISLAMLHLEYFVANLVRRFEWLPAAAAEGVNLTEKVEFTVVMKNPLMARVVPRVR